MGEVGTVKAWQFVMAAMVVVAAIARVFGNAMVPVLDFAGGGWWTMSSDDVIRL